VVTNLKLVLLVMLWKTLLLLISKLLSQIFQFYTPNAKPTMVVMLLLPEPKKLVMLVSKLNLKNKKLMVIIQMLKPLVILLFKLVTVELSLLISPLNLITTTGKLSISDKALPKNQLPSFLSNPTMVEIPPVLE
jgi:hypothetical protein